MTCYLSSRIILMLMRMTKEEKRITPAYYFIIFSPQIEHFQFCIKIETVRQSEFRTSNLALIASASTAPVSVLCESMIHPSITQAYDSFFHIYNFQQMIHKYNFSFALHPVEIPDVMTRYGLTGKRNFFGHGTAPDLIVSTCANYSDNDHRTIHSSFV